MRDLRDIMTTDSPCATNDARGLALAIQTSRPGFWSTSVWFYLLPLAQRDVLAMPAFWVGLLYVTFPLGHVLYGWNDLFDARTDKENPRKGSYLFGAKPTAGHRRAVPLQLLCVQVPFVVWMVWLDGVRMLGWFAALVLACALYNWPRVGCKNHPFVDMLNQTGYLLVFVLSSWLNDVPQLAWPGFVFGALFAMHSHLLGQVMDVVPDRAAGRRTTAVTIGVVPAKFLAAAIMAVEAALVVGCYRDLLVAGGLMLGAAWFVADAVIVKARPYEVWQARLFLWAWNVAAIVTIPVIWMRGTFATGL